jgi:hypothetical protein
MATLTRSRVRRVLTTVACTCIGIGLTLWFMTPKDSLLNVVGYMLAAIWLLPAIMFGPFLILMHLNNQYRKRISEPSPQALFARGAVVPELAVDLIMLAESRGGRLPRLGAGQHSMALAIGNEGYTVRFMVPEGSCVDDQAARRVEVQFLAPQLALPRFAPGTAFRALDLRGVIGEGTVIEALPRAA